MLVIDHQDISRPHNPNILPLKMCFATARLQWAQLLAPLALPSGLSRQSVPCVAFDMPAAVRYSTRYSLSSCGCRRGYLRLRTTDFVLVADTRCDASTVILIPANVAEATRFARWFTPAASVATDSQNLSNPKPDISRPGRDGAVRGGAAGRARPGRIEHRRVSPHGRQPSFVHSRLQKTVMNHSTKAQINEILCKSMEKHNERLTTDAFAV